MLVYLNYFERMSTVLAIVLFIFQHFMLTTSIEISVSTQLMSPLLNTFHNESDSNCGLTCEAIDLLGPPPNDILFMPPPPLPPFLQQILAENESLQGDNERCNYCHLFQDPAAFDTEILLNKAGGAHKTEKWSSTTIVITLGSLVSAVFLLVLLFKYKKWKIFPVSESCPVFAESFLGGHKSAPAPCSPSDSCISPVVNEKSPQSVITDEPSKKTSIPTKYWRRGINTLGPEGRQVDELDPYRACSEASCTSSPVYAELDAAGVTITHAMANQNPSVMLGSSSISHYGYGNTYSEVADAVRMAALGSSSALLPDSSYDNAAYLPTAQNDHYSRSLRRHRSLAHQLGSTTPLLSSHYVVNGSPQLNYLTGTRPHKKPRPIHAQGLPPRANLIRMQEELQSTHLDHQLGYGHARRQIGHGIYSDIPSHLTTFRSQYASKDNPKRPLPPVPGVRL